MSLYDDLEARGLVKQVTDPEMKAALSRGRLTLYCGFDPTSDNLHVGSLLPLLTLRRFQDAGHRPIAVVGGATGMIGDPSGKSQERQLLTEEVLRKNVEGIRKVVSKFLRLDGPNAALLVNNADWFSGLSYIDFLRDVGKHFTVNHMVAKESVRARLEDREHGISYTEFSYMLLQAYDFHVLHEREKCTLQIGGSDQWGNITAGIELIRRMRADAGQEAATVFGMTHPLVMKSDGTKFGKSETGTVWLGAEKTSPYAFYQWLLQTTDADVMNYLKYFSMRPMPEILALGESLTREPEKRNAQQALARELTELVHGKAELERAEKASQALFGTGIRELDERTLLDVLAGAPSTTKDKSALGTYALIDALVDTGLCASKGAARKDVTAGGVYVNNERVQDAAATLAPKDLIAGAYVVLRKGKRTYHLMQFR
ncbi:MAG: tyrosine--tRNA ligase [Bdellovibrionota bacterium]